MDDLTGKVAVITGAASGIGRAMTDRFAAAQMRLVLADIEAESLAATVDELREAGAEVIGVPTDVSDAAAIEALRDEALSAFGGIHVACNNAGVGGGGRTWEIPLELWKWVLDVDLWSVIHGIRSFVPVMREQNEGHVVNTASLAGLTSTPGMGPYNVAKHGVVTLSETLHHELAMEGSAVGVSVLCPAFVRTRIHESDRNAPDHVTDLLAAEGKTPEESERRAAMRDISRSLVESGIDPVEVANQVHDAVIDRRFYIVTHPESIPRITGRVQRIADGEHPMSSFG